MSRAGRFVLLAILLFPNVVSGQTSTPVPPPANQAIAEAFDVRAAVEAYLAKMPPAQRARSDAYFEGDYWLLLWDFLSTVAVMWLLLRFRWSARMRNLAERLTHLRPLQTALYWVQFIVIVSAVTFPLGLYEGYFREHRYGLLNQTFGPWMWDQIVMLLVSVVLGAMLMVPLFGLVRRLGKSWWVWGATLTVVFAAFVSLIAPVYIAPLFNKYKTLQDPHIKDPILSMARANGIPATDVYEFDASRQTKRISANVSGLFGTTRISMNDNLLKRCDHDEIIAVLGHEMGHYVLNHAALLLTWYGLLFLAGFAFVNWGYGRIVNLYGADWGVRGLDDVAGLPVLAALMSFFFLVATPVSNTITRSAEAQADIFGINAVRKPDGFARATLMLSEYRKLDPSPLEEFVFYDHPSGRSRILMAMRWKLEHRNDWDVKNGPVSPQ